MGKSKELAELGNAVTQSGGTTTFSDDTTAIVSTQSGSITLQNYAYATGFTYDLSNASQAHSVGTSSSAPTILKTGNVERMRIDASGRVTMPYQPYFYVYSSAVNLSYSSNQVLPFDLIYQEQGGSNYNTSTSRFTAPVSGVYSFTCYAYGNSSTSNHSIEFRVNGNIRMRGQVRDGISDGYIPLSMITQLSTNDYVDVRAGPTGVTNFYGGNNLSYSQWSGILVG